MGVYNEDSKESIINALEFTLEIYKFDPVSNYFFWRNLNRLLNVQGKSKYEIAARRLAVLHLFKGDNYCEVAEMLELNTHDVRNDVEWSYNNKKNVVKQLSAEILKSTQY